MVSRSELKEEFEDSGYAWEDGDDARFARFVACLEYLFESDDPRGIVEIREELGYDHDTARNACVWGENRGYVDRTAQGCSVTEEGAVELAELFE